MKKLFLILLMFHLTITGTFAQEQISVSRFQGQKITGIEAHGAFNITARQGTSTGVTVNIPTRFEKHLVLKLNSQGKLFIGFDGRMKDKDKKNRHHDEFTAEITVTDLNSIELTGVCKLEAIGNFTTDRLKSICREPANSLQKEISK